MLPLPEIRASSSSVTVILQPPDPEMAAENSEVSTSLLLAYLVNNDMGILDCESSEEWPPGYLNNVEDFFNLISFYIRFRAYSFKIPLIDQSF